jgi:hypothetical protein
LSRASNSSTDTVHVKACQDLKTVHEKEDLATLLACTLIASFELAVPITYEFSNLRLYTDWSQLKMAYVLQGVVRFGPPGPHRGASHDHDQAAQWLASQIDICFDDEDLHVPAGQIFIRNISELILTRPESLASTDPEELAIIKLSNLIKTWPGLTDSQYPTKLDFLKSRIKPVKSDFRLSSTDLFQWPGPK